MYPQEGLNMVNNFQIKRKIKLAFHGECHYNSLVPLNSNDNEIDSD